MEKKLQDLAWTSLPKEMRDKLIEWYQTFQYHTNFDNDPIAEAQMKLLEDLYGSHNLTSDTEPEEMLMVERKKVQEIYHQIKLELGDGGCSERQDDINMEKESLLHSLFGDKCLPDEKLTKSKQEMETEIIEIATEVKPKPKFSLNEIVRVTSDDKYGTVGRIIKVDEEDDGFFYTLNGVIDWRFVEKNLAPYTE